MCAEAVKMKKYIWQKPAQIITQMKPAFWITFG
jgi:hypothetical protein